MLGPVPAGLVDERLEETLVVLHLGVPEDADREALRGILERLERAVLGLGGLDEPLPHAADALVVARLHRVVAGAEDRREPRPVLAPSTGCSENTPSVSRWPSWPTSSGRCWTRSPPRSTFRSWKPRQIASVGRSRSSARVEQRELAGVAVGLRWVGRRDGARRRRATGRCRCRRRRRSRRARRACRRCLVRGRDEQRPAAGALDRLDVVERYERRGQLPRTPAGGLRVRGDPDDRPPAHAAKSTPRPRPGDAFEVDAAGQPRSK